ncbi:DMT family transporter [Chelatococcus sp. SYSU_G07232]|uniref:DMT family transporter n=1 Tax=Chelatococcus albus TaxID=3047466 RepID=A0ABT7AEM7_9HYPH|nr:DMT family transporter [Chelatococcus sp. SYSU_G07232]MDJ1157819.1 DMT family transporter [Chelatococcus sp. SYSU_G07232]
MSAATGEKITPTTDTRERSSFWVGCTLSALGAVLFSTKGIIIKLAYAEDIDTETLLALRMLLSVPIFAAIGLLALNRRRAAAAPPPGRRLHARAIALGLLGYWCSSYLDFLGLAYVSAQFERLILFTYPFFVVLFGMLIFRERVRARALAAFAVSYAGLALAFVDNLALSGDGVILGAALVLTSAVTYALYQVLAKPTIAVMGPPLFTCVTMLAAAAGAILQFLLTHPVGALAVSPRALGLGVLIALGATVVPSFLLNAALGRIPAQVNATIGMLSPVVTIVLAFLVLGESMSLLGALGAALVIGGIAGFVLAERR